MVSKVNDVSVSQESFSKQLSPRPWTACTAEYDRKKPGREQQSKRELFFMIAVLRLVSLERILGGDPGNRQKANRKTE